MPTHRADDLAQGRRSTGFRLRQRPISIRYSLARNLMSMIVATSAAILLVSYAWSTRIVAELSSELITQQIDHTELALREFFQPVETVLHLFRDWGTAGLLDPVDVGALDRAHLSESSGGDTDFVVRLNQRFVPLLERLPQISALMFANTAGEEYQLRRADALWRNRITAAGRWSRRAFRADRDASGALVAQRWDALDYDPRSRPWFTGAVEAGADTRVHWTEPYKFFTSKEPGITASVQWPDPLDPDRRVVMALDVLLRDISHFTQTLPVGQYGKVLVATEDARIIGLPADDRFDSPAAVRSHLLAPIRDLALPALEDGIRAWEEQAHAPGDVYSFRSGGEVWWAGVRVFPVGQRSFRIAVLVPERDFMAGIIQQRNIVIGVTAAALAGAFLVALALARRYSRPLSALAAQAERIEHLDVANAEPISSRLVEVGQLADTQERMRTALDSFARYVPIDVVRELMRRGQAASIGGARRTITVMFTDIQGFTTIAEATPPEQLTRHMAVYFDAMLGTVQGDGFGEVTQLTGDGFVAFWGAPIDCADHAARAAEAVIRCRERLAALNARWTADGRPALPTRFGLATGPVVVGNVGSPARLVYTAVGDTINLASRLEGLNRFFGTWVLMSEDARNAAGDAFAWRRVDRVRAKGKHEPIELYELLGRRGEVDAAVLEFASRYEAALALYRARRFDDAERALAALQVGFPHDLSVARLLELTRGFRDAPPPATWDGTTVFREK